MEPRLETGRVTVLTGRRGLRSLQFFDESGGWAAGNGNGLYKTSDGGETWEQVTIDDSAELSVSNLFFVNRSEGWVVLTDRKNSDYRLATIKIIKTSDGGGKWKVQYSGTGLHVTRIKFLDEQNGWVVGMGTSKDKPIDQVHFVIHTKDGGKTWTDTSQQVNHVVADDRGYVLDDITDIQSTSSSNVTLLSLRGKLIGTTNGGAAWSQVDAIESEPNQTCICRIGTTVSGRRWVAGGTYQPRGYLGRVVGKKR